MNKAINDPELLKRQREGFDAELRRAPGTPVPTQPTREEAARAAVDLAAVLTERFGEPTESQ